MYYEGVDYHIRKLPFPNLASESLLLSNGDGSYVILLNSRFPEEVLRLRLAHERPVTEKEAEAEGKPGGFAAPQRARTAAKPKPEAGCPAYVPVPGLDYFSSWGRAMQWVQEMLEQTGKE